MLVVSVSNAVHKKRHGEECHLIAEGRNQSENFSGALSERTKMKFASYCRDVHVPNIYSVVALASEQVLVEVSLLQQHDLRAVVAQVHAPKGNGNPLTPANALSTLRHTFRTIGKINHNSNGKANLSADKASASAALTLAFWWLELRTQAFELAERAQMSAANASAITKATELAASCTRPRTRIDSGNSSSKNKSSSSDVEDAPISANGWCRHDLCRSCCTLDEHRRKDPKL